MIYLNALYYKPGEGNAIDEFVVMEEKTITKKTKASTIKEKYFGLKNTGTNVLSQNLTEKDIIKKYLTSRKEVIESIIVKASEPYKDEYDISVYVLDKSTPSTDKDEEPFSRK